MKPSTHVYVYSENGSVNKCDSKAQYKNAQKTFLTTGVDAANKKQMIWEK